MALGILFPMEHVGGKYVLDVPQMLEEIPYWH
jgi:hypothetical protein